MSTIKRVKNLPQRHIDFRCFIVKILRHVRPGASITQLAKDELNSIINYMGNSLSEKALKLSSQCDKKTISPKNIISSIQIIIPGDLGKEGIIYGEEAVEKINDKTNLFFPPHRVKKFMTNYKKRLGKNSPVYLSSILGHVCSELLKIAGDVMKNLNKMRITVRHLYLAVENNAELNKTFHNLNINWSGHGNFQDINNERGPEETNCVYFPKSSFRKYTRDIIQKYEKNVRVSGEAFVILQLYIENYLKRLLSEAGMASRHAGRIRVFPEDIQFIRKIHDNY